MNGGGQSEEYNAANTTTQNCNHLPQTTQKCMKNQLRSFFLYGDLGPLGRTVETSSLIFSRFCQEYISVILTVNILELLCLSHFDHQLVRCTDPQISRYLNDKAPQILLAQKKSINQKSFVLMTDPFHTVGLNLLSKEELFDVSELHIFTWTYDNFRLTSTASG